jgi:argininosuccinate synthase
MKIVLAYSAGLDNSAFFFWIKKKYNLGFEPYKTGFPFQRVSK